jgi:hypothetical protein
MTFGSEIKRMEITYILVFSTPMNRENLSEFIHFISNHSYINSTGASCFVSVSMETIERSNVMFVTDGHLLPLIIIVC